MGDYDMRWSADEGPSIPQMGPPPLDPHAHEDWSYQASLNSAMAHDRARTSNLEAKTGPYSPVLLTDGTGRQWRLLAAPASASVSLAGLQWVVVSDGSTVSIAGGSELWRQFEGPITADIFNYDAVDGWSAAAVASRLVCFALSLDASNAITLVTLELRNPSDGLYTLVTESGVSRISTRYVPIAYLGSGALVESQFILATPVLVPANVAGYAAWDLR